MDNSSYRLRLVQAFEMHVCGNSAGALKKYNEVLARNPHDVFARALINLLNMQVTFPRMSKYMALRQLKDHHFLPKTVIDVGAQVGTPPLYEVFPDAHHLMIEPVVEHEPTLRYLCESLRSAEYKIAAVSDQPGKVLLELSETRQYAQIVDQAHTDGEVRQVESISLDAWCADKTYAGPMLIKIDVDGKEIEVLKGAASLAVPDNIFVIEATLIDQEPRFSRILDFFKPYGFVLYDIIDPMHRPADGALWQVDVIMVHESSPLRQMKQYA